MYAYVREHLRVLHVNSKNVFFFASLAQCGCLDLIYTQDPDTPETSLILEI